MREIKFRAWDKTWKRWIDPRDINYYGEMDWMFDRRSAEGGDVIETADRREVELMQFTGLKDKNGKEIYEGDIVHFESKDTGWDDGLCGDVVVCFVDGWFIFKKTNIFSYAYNKKICRVIGNIYENPDLVTP